MKLLLVPSLWFLITWTHVDYAVAKNLQCAQMLQVGEVDHKGEMVPLKYKRSICSKIDLETTCCTSLRPEQECGKNSSGTCLGVVCSTPKGSIHGYGSESDISSVYTYGNHVILQARAVLSNSSNYLGTCVLK